MRRSFQPSHRSGASYGADTLATGYYKDGGGYAWYYSAEGNYFDLIAAPSASKTKKRTRFTSGEFFEDAKKNAASRSASTKEEVLATATSSGGAELPDPDGLAKGVVVVEETISGSDEKREALTSKRPVRGGRKMRGPGGLSTAQMVGIGAAGIALLVGVAFVVRSSTK